MDTISLDQIDEVTTPPPTMLVPNPLNAYASYTYSWSLWWLSVFDYNSLISQESGTKANEYELTKSGINASFVIAEDGGVFIDQRLPSTLDLNYNIQDVNFTTVIGLNRRSGPMNMIEGSMTIIEPCGISLIDSMIAASVRPDPVSGKLTYLNYTQQPYMLQLDFKGYDDSGNFIVDNPPMPLRKRFPIGINTIKINFTSKGTEYKLNFTPKGGEAKLKEYRTLPAQMSVQASTVGEFLTALQKAINTFYNTQKNSGKIAISDGILFDIDPIIAKKKITNTKENPWGDSSMTSKTYDPDIVPFTLPAGTEISSIIDRVIALSTYLADQTTELSSNLDSQTKSSNIYKSE